MLCTLRGLVVLVFGLVLRYDSEAREQRTRHPTFSTLPRQFRRCAWTRGMPNGRKATIAAASARKAP